MADEIITSRAGKRVRVGNTDAEGRMVMADVLCKFKEMVMQITVAFPLPLSPFSLHLPLPPHLSLSVSLSLSRFCLALTFSLCVPLSGWLIVFQVRVRERKT